MIANVVSGNGQHNVEESRRRDAVSGAWVDRGVLLGLFAVSRVVYAVAGVRFDATGLDYSSQLLDPTLLRDRLGESVWFLHAQPPAFNLFVGFVLRWSPFSPSVSFHLLFIVCGIALIFGVRDLARRLGLGRRAAIVTAALICCAPTVALYENWLSYEYPVATMLVWMVVLVARYGRRPSTAGLVAIMSVATLATLTRSLLHPGWLLAVLVPLVAYRRPVPVKRVLLALLPLLLVGLVIAKNQVLFGSPQLSSWFGYNLHKVVYEPLTEEQRAQLRDEGFTGVATPSCPPTSPDAPAVTDVYKREWRGEGGEGILNFNNVCVINQFNDFEVEARAIARAHPKWMVRNVAGGFEIWASPSSITPFVYSNRNEIDRLESAYRRSFLLDVAWDPWIPIPHAWPVGLSAPDHRFHVSLTLVFATLGVALASIVALAQWRQRNAARLAVLVGGGTVVFVTLIGNLFENGENNRIRFIVEPLTMVLAVAIGAAVVRRVIARVRSAERDPLGEASPVAVPGDASTTGSSVV